MINLMIVDDSEVFLKLLDSVFKNEKDINISGFARNGLEALELFKKITPDIVIMDLMMPLMSGIEAINEIAKIADIRKHPIIIFSSIASSMEIKSIVKALTNGAIEIIEKPKSFAVEEINKMKNNLLKIIKEIHDKDSLDISEVIKVNPLMLPKTATDLIVIGGSIGSPGAIVKILNSLKRNILIPPMLFIIHMSEGFLRYYIEAIKEELNITIKEAEHKEILKPGIIYFAPDNRNLELIMHRGEIMALLHLPDLSSKIIPSINYTFTSIAKLPIKVIAGVLTGMGRDGADGLLKIKQNKGFTFIEKFDDCIAIGMPSSALNIGAVDAVFSLQEIAGQLIKMGCRIKKKE